LSDHDGQIKQLENISMQIQSSKTRIIQNFIKCNVHDFKTKVSYGIWDAIFGENDVNKILNNFHILLRIFYSIFSKKKTQVQIKDSTWMTKV